MNMWWYKAFCVQSFAVLKRLSQIHHTALCFELKQCTCCNLSLVPGIANLSVHNIINWIFLNGLLDEDFISPWALENCDGHFSVLNSHLDNSFSLFLEGSHAMAYRLIYVLCSPSRLNLTAKVIHVSFSVKLYYSGATPLITLKELLKGLSGADSDTWVMWMSGIQRILAFLTQLAPKLMIC